MDAWRAPGAELSLGEWARRHLPGLPDLEAALEHEQFPVNMGDSLAIRSCGLSRRVWSALSLRLASHPEEELYMQIMWTVVGLS